LYLHERLIFWLAIWRSCVQLMYATGWMQETYLKGNKHWLQEFGALFGISTKYVCFVLNQE
jgi:uncharacterized membrane protein YhdT